MCTVRAGVISVNTCSLIFCGVVFPDVRHPVPPQAVTQRHQEVAFEVTFAGACDVSPESRFDVICEVRVEVARKGLFDVAIDITSSNGVEAQLQSARRIRTQP